MIGCGDARKASAHVVEREATEPTQRKARPGPMHRTERDAERMCTRRIDRALTRVHAFDEREERDRLFPDERHRWPIESSERPRRRHACRGQVREERGVIASAFFTLLFEETNEAFCPSVAGFELEDEIRIHASGSDRNHAHEASEAMRGDQLTSFGIGERSECSHTSSVALADPHVKSRI